MTQRLSLVRVAILFFLAEVIGERATKLTSIIGSRDEQINFRGHAEKS